MRRHGRVAVAVLAVAAIIWSANCAAQTVVHGADSLFVSPTLKLAWGVLKGKAEADTRVVIRVLNVAGEYRFLRVDGVDPFTKARIVFVETLALDKAADVSIGRAKFADHPSTELHLFRDEASLRTNSAAMVVYYLGVPDTAPEFTAPEAMGAYLGRMLGIAR